MKVDAELAWVTFLETRDYQAAAKALDIDVVQLQRIAINENWAKRLADHDKAVVQVEDASDEQDPVLREVERIRTLRQAVMGTIARALRNYVGQPDKLINAYLNLVKAEHMLTGKPTETHEVTFKQVIQETFRQFVEVVPLQQEAPPALEAEQE